MAGPRQSSGPAGDAPLVLRGNALKDALVLRVLAVERFVRGLPLVALTYGVYRFDGSRNSLEKVFREYLPLASWRTAPSSCSRGSRCG